MKNIFSRIPANKRLQGIFLIGQDGKTIDCCPVWDADGKSKLFARLVELEKQGIAAHVEDEKGERLS